MDISTNGLKQRIPVYVVSIVLTLLPAYFAAQMVVTKEMGDRPTRQEVRESLRESTDGIQRQLDDIKKQAEKTYERVEKFGDKLDRILQKNGR